MNLNALANTVINAQVPSESTPALTEAPITTATEPSTSTFQALPSFPLPLSDSDTTTTATATAAAATLPQDTTPTEHTSNEAKASQQRMSQLMSSFLNSHRFESSASCSKKATSTLSDASVDTTTHQTESASQAPAHSSSQPQQQQASSDGSPTGACVLDVFLLFVRSFNL